MELTVSRGAPAKNLELIYKDRRNGWKAGCEPTKVGRGGFCRTISASGNSASLEMVRRATKDAADAVEKTSRRLWIKPRRVDTSEGPITLDWVGQAGVRDAQGPETRQEALFVTGDVSKLHQVVFNDLCFSPTVYFDRLIDILTTSL